MKKLVQLLTITAIMLMSICGMVFAQDITVKVNRDTVFFPDQKPFINCDSRTLVPVRFISQELGASVSWDANTQTVNINNRGTAINLTIGSKIASVGSGQVTLDTSAEIVNSRTMVPLRFVSECLGAKVEWVQATQTINIWSANYMSDAALINSDLRLGTPPAGTSRTELSVAVVYFYTTPVEPQMADLKEIIYKHLGSAGDPVYEYAAMKTSGKISLRAKEWTISGKTVQVGDSGGSLTVTIWN